MHARTNARANACVCTETHTDTKSVSLLSHFHQNVSRCHVCHILTENLSKKESLFDNYLDTFDVIENENCESRSHLQKDVSLYHIRQIFIIICIYLMC